MAANLQKPLCRCSPAHSDSIWTLQWSASDKIISGSVDETVSVWRFKDEKDGSLQKLMSLDGHQLGVISVAAHPKGNLHNLARQMSNPI